jgi:hypothetical protein
LLANVLAEVVESETIHGRRFENRDPRLSDGNERLQFACATKHILLASDRWRCPRPENVRRLAVQGHMPRLPGLRVFTCDGEYPPLEIDVVPS